MIENLFGDVVVRRRFFTLLMVAGALMLGVTLALLIVNLQTRPVASQTTQSPGSAVAVAPPTTQAVVPTTSPPVTPPSTAPQPTIVKLGMADFTTACRQQHGPTATAKIVRNPSEPPSYWVKCFIQRVNVGGVSLDDYCPSIEPGTRSDNSKRFDYAASDHPWLSWECVPA